MNKAIQSRIQNSLGCLLAVLAFASFVSTASAADPEIVGVLADAIEPNIAKSLELSSEQLDNIQQLINQQESKVLDLHVKSRELPKAEAQELLKKSVAALEAEAFKILTVEQRSKLEQVRLNRIGLRSLAEQSIAETLGLSEGQNEQIKTILSSRIQILREVGADRVDIETQNRLRKVLTNAQFATWQAMAGGGKVSARTLSEAAANDAAATVAQVPADKQDSAADQIKDDAQSPVNATATNKVARATSTAEPAAQGQASTEQDVANLTLNFNNADWSTVLKWMAKEADLSLQLDTIPTGTFTYRDVKKYTVEKAMDIMNSVLLGKGYTLVRRQRTLLVVDLGSGDSADVTRGLIRELAELVTPDELDDRGEFELLKCLFMLSRLTPEEAEKQITALIGPQGSVIPLASANQILVVETGGKLRLIRDMIERAENPDPSQSTKIANFPLKNVAAEEVLAIARGHLGITEESANSADGITISTDTYGSTIYASGRADKIQMLGEIVAKVDVVPPEGSASNVQTQQAVLRIHPIVSGDPAQALNVLQTMFTGAPNVRLSLDTVSKSIIAMASPSDQKVMEDTLAELGGNSAKFEIIPLTGRLDTRSMIATLEKLLGKASDGDAAKGGGQVPLIYGDAAARTLMVKGTAQQVALVREMVERIESSGPSLSMLGSGVKFYPGTGKSNQRMIDQIQSVLQAQNKGIKIKVRTQHSEEIESRANSRRMQLGSDPLPPERPPVVPPRTQEQPPKTPASKPAAEPVPAADSKNDRVTSDDVSKTHVPQGKLVWAQSDEAQPDEAVESSEEAANDQDDQKAEEAKDVNAKKESTIEVIQTANGLIVTSDDPDALAQWEQMAMMMNEQMANGPVEPTIFYLKYVPAAPAADLIRQAMSGKVATDGGGGGGLIGDVASSVLGGGGGLIGSLLGGGGGGSTVSGPALASGEISIIPEIRLNMLIVYANPADLDLVDKLIEVMDQEDSPLLIQTTGRPQIIPLQYAEATEVVTIVKEVFASRMAQAANAGGAGGGNRQPSPQEFIEALRGGGRRGGGGGGNQSTPMPEPKMTITANVRNNEIVVNGPNSLFLEVKALVEQIDQGSIENQEDVQVIPLGGGVSASLLQGALQSVLGDQARTNIAGQQNGQNQQRNGQNNNNQQRNQFQGGNFGGGFGGFGGGGFGGGNFGGGNFNRGGAGNFGGGNFGGGNFGGGNNQQRGNNQQQRGGNNQQQRGGNNQQRGGGGGAARTQGGR